MSRTYRLRHLPQPEGRRLARRFVDSNVREPAYRAEEVFLSHLAHRVLKLPCRWQHPPMRWKDVLGRSSHEYCLPKPLRDQLWSMRFSNRYWRFGWARTVPTYWHPIIGYSLPHVPSAHKKWGRKQAYRVARRHTKRLLRVVRWTQYLDESFSASEDWWEAGWISLPKSGLEIDPDEDRSDFDARGVKAGLARSAWLLTW